MIKLTTAIFIGFMALLKLQTVGFAKIETNLQPDAIVGSWWTPEKDAKLIIEKREGNIEKQQEKKPVTLYFGKLADLLPEKKNDKDDKNPDAALRERKIDGLEILQNFEFDGKDAWTAGTIYDPKSGKTYKCEIHLKDEKTLKVRGYIGIPLLGRTEYFTKVEQK